MLNRDGEVNHNNPIYSAGFMEGRAFERELIKEQQQKKRDAMTFKISALDMDIVKELAEITKSLADYIESSHTGGIPTPEALELLSTLDNFLDKSEERRKENEKKMESFGLRGIRQ